MSVTPGYLVPLKTLLTNAMTTVFDAEYPEEDFRDIYVSIEFPAERASYPAIWVDFDPIGDLETVGINHLEFTDPDVNDNRQSFRRWHFKGLATYTAVALTSLERDRLFDELCRVMAFGDQTPMTAQFRGRIENNDFIACTIDFDQIGQRGFAANPGTPWGTPEMLYECTVAMEVVGEFVSDPGTGLLLPISEILSIPYTELEGDPTLGDGGNPWM